MRAENAAIAAETEWRRQRRAADQTLERERQALQALRSRADRDVLRMTGLDAQLGRLEIERTVVAAERAAAQTAFTTLPSMDVARQAVQEFRLAQGGARSAEHTARAALETLEREAAARDARRSLVDAERRGWAGRADEAALRSADLANRWDEAQSRIAELVAKPDQLTAAGKDAAMALQQADALHRRAGEWLGAAELAAVTADRAERAAALALAGAREAVLRGEADCRDIGQAWATLAERIIERLGPDAELPIPADLSDEAMERARRRQERLVRERDEMGPVNLRAEIEAGEIESQLVAIGSERDEMTAAINKLRGSIGHLNREGRERLTEVFAAVDRHFQALFVRMFGGGRAQLALVGSDDPVTGGARDLRTATGQETCDLVAAVWGGAGADCTVADLCGISMQSRAGMRAG